MYFSLFPYLLYPSFDDPSQNVIVKDITTRVVKSLSRIDDRTIYYDYTILENETPQLVSLKEYGDINYYWVIMIVNNLFDLNWDFPLNYNEFNSYLTEKYGSIANASNSYIYFILPCKDSSEFVQVPKSTYDNYSEYTDGILTAYALSLYDWEMEQNENKRTIKILRKELLAQFVNTFSSLL